MLKGYKSPCGNYITIVEQKKRIAKMKKADKQARIKREEEEQKEYKYKLDLYIAEKIEQQKAIQDKENHIIQCRNFIKYCSEFFKDYNQYLIGWDIVNSNKYQIESDLYNNKITINQIKEVYNKAKIMIENIDKYIYINDLIAI